MSVRFLKTPRSDYVPDLFRGSDLHLINQIGIHYKIRYRIFNGLCEACDAQKLTASSRVLAFSLARDVTSIRTFIAHLRIQAYQDFEFGS